MAMGCCCGTGVENSWCNGMAMMNEVGVEQDCVLKWELDLMALLALLL